MRGFLYRAATELLANVVKHARASHAAIILEGSEKRVSLTVKDDGQGFTYINEAIEKPSGFGLFSIKERLRHLGGSLTVQSRLGLGTTAVMELPLTL
jgi:signal transduction histidine kinase